MFSKMKTGTKVLVGFGVAIAIAMVVGTVGYNGISKLGGHVKDIGGNFLPSIRGLNLIAKGMLNVAYGDRGLSDVRLIDKDDREAEYKRIGDGLKIADEGFKMYEPLPREAEEDALWKEFKNNWDEWSKKRQVIVDLSHAKDELVKAGEKLDGIKSKRRTIRCFRPSVWSAQLA
jgi:methyl-accepting chemotaxis protein